MTVTTIYLRFEDRAAALAALAPLGLVGETADGGSDFVPTAGVDGIRVDLSLVGGDGVHRRRVAADDPLAETEEATEVVPGFHLDLRWSDGTPPDFAAAEIHPRTPSRTFAP